MTARPGTSAGQPAEPCTSAAEQTADADEQHAAADDRTGRRPCRTRPIAAETPNAVTDSGNPVRPAWIGLGPSTDCSQIEV